MGAGRLGTLTRAVLGFGLRCLLVLVVVEGVASLILVALSLPELVEPPLAERRHTRYDAELGWVNEPGVRIQHLYGPGRTLSINDQGFRGTRSYPERVPAGRLRVICSGDSFTLGYGVGDPDTWCARLEALDPRLESVNMGQGGYGIDQSFLWYARDGVALEHQIHIVAFIREDFGRMQRDAFLGYGKPVLRVEGERLVTRNVPVPRTAYSVPWLVQNAKLVGELRSVRLLRPLVRALVPDPGPELTMGQLAELSLRVFAELERLSREHDSTLVLVYLPSRGDYRNRRDLWRRKMGAEAQRRGLVFIDLVDAMQQLPRQEAAALFIPDGSIEFPGADGHYNREGNAWVARELLARLLHEEPVKRRLEALADSAIR